MFVRYPCVHRKMKHVPGTTVAVGTCDNHARHVASPSGVICRGGIGRAVTRSSPRHQILHPDGRGCRPRSVSSLAEVSGPAIITGLHLQHAFEAQYGRESCRGFIEEYAAGGSGFRVPFACVC